MLGDSKTAPAGAAAMPEALDGYALCFQATLRAIHIPRIACQ